MTLTEESRRESNQLTDRQSRYKQILGAWEGEMTAREIGLKLGYRDLNAVKPRITELVKLGRLVPVGRKFDLKTNRNVTCWILNQEA